MNVTARKVKQEFDRNEAVCTRTLTLFHLISNKARFRIICLLSRGEFCVNDIAEVVRQGNLSNISQQLRILSLAGLVQKRREERRILYTLKDERVRNVISFLRKQYLAKGR